MMNFFHGKDVRRNQPGDREQPAMLCMKLMKERVILLMRPIQ